MSHRERLERDLRSALAAGALSVAYQPIFDLGSRRITGFEALARWNHPELGPISPLSFIALAEETGLIVPLTDFVLHSACRQLREWHLLDDSLSDLTVHVNVSGHDVVRRGFPGRVCTAIEESQLQPRHLTLELAENVLIERLEAALPILNELRDVGVGLSLDDFGTGYSSLRHLSALPVSSLKIDRGIVQELRRGSGDVALLRAIVSLATSLGKSIIAEGIETAPQIEQLRRLGCRAGQGYYLARPLSASLVGKMLAGSLASARSRETIERVAADAQPH